MLKKDNWCILYFPYILKAGNTKSKSHNLFFFFFKQQCLPFPLLLLSMCTQPANWMCAKDPGLCIQVFTRFLEYRNFERFCNEILFVSSMQHKRFFLSITFFYNTASTMTDEKAFVVASLFEVSHTNPLHVLCGVFPIKKYNLWVHIQACGCLFSLFCSFGVFFLWEVIQWAKHGMTIWHQSTNT